MIDINDLRIIYTQRKTLRKKSTFNAVDGVSIKINDGEIVALLGSNGSGKSTFLKAITGVIKPTSGTIYIDNLHPWKNRKSLTKRIGVVFGQKSSLIQDLNVRDNLEMFSIIYDIDKNAFIKQLELMDEYFNINEYLDKPVRKLSFGQRMRCELASILMHNPSYIFLDEPTIGLDIFAKEELFKLLKSYNHKFNSTIIITTHEIDSLELLCDRIALIDNGKIILDSKPDEITNFFKEKRKITVAHENILDDEAYRILNNKFSFEKVNPHKTIIEYLSNDSKEIMDIIFKTFSIIDLKSESLDLKGALKNYYAANGNKKVH